MEANAEHEEDYADFGEIVCNRGVGAAAGGIRTDGDAREQVANDRRQAYAGGEKAAEKRRDEGGDQGEDELGMEHL